jgi:hypothetical protein
LSRVTYLSKYTMRLQGVWMEVPSATSGLAAFHLGGLWSAASLNTIHLYCRHATTLIFWVRLDTILYLCRDRSPIHQRNTDQREQHQPSTTHSNFWCSVHQTRDCLLHYNYSVQLLTHYGRTTHAPPPKRPTILKPRTCVSPTRTVTNPPLTVSPQSLVS